MEVKLGGNDFFQKCLAQAVFDVFEMMVGMQANHIMDESDDQLSEGDITGVMIIQGDRKAMLYLTLKRNHAAEIVSYMTGMTVAEVTDEDLYDGVAELVNMIAGRAKALLAGTGDHYTITPPFTIVGNDHFIVYKKEVSKFSMKFSAGEAKLYLGLTYF